MAIMAALRDYRYRIPMRLVRTAWKSVRGYGKLALTSSLHLRRQRRGEYYVVKQDSFRVFRETVQPKAVGAPTILVIGFRLKLVRSNPLLHWFFQRVCIVTTPFWSGLSGFHTKLWLYSPESSDYLGIYEWRGRAQAQNYLDFLLPILRFFSVEGSVWQETLTDTSLQEFLDNHRHA